MSAPSKALLRELSLSCKNCSLGELCMPYGLSANDIDKLDQSVSHTKLLQKGETLYRQGTSFKSLYAVKSGSVKITSLNQEASEDVIGIYLPGEIIGFDGIATGEYQCTIHAIETSNVCEINLAEVQENIPGVSQQLLKHAGKAINHGRYARSVAKVSARKRIISFLLDLSDRYRHRGYLATEFELYLSRGELGNLLNLSAETISREIHKLEREKLISIVNKRRIQIKQMDQLKEILIAP
ncbi:MAG: helix-turn-helix domain-containing protein [Cycloclasticus sp.]